MVKRYIVVRENFIGFHKFTKAPNCVGFLANAHRHRFYVTAKIEVFEEDRELEFFIVQGEIQKTINQAFLNYKAEIMEWSCERWARHIYEGISNSFCINISSEECRKRYVSIEVSEDNECSGVYEVNPYEK